MKPIEKLFLSVVRSQLGTQEHPRGSNRVVYSLWYGMIGSWCAMFVSWCAWKTGIPTTVIPKHAYTPAGVGWFREKGQYKRTPRVGDIVYYRFPGWSRVSHVGIVIKVYSDGSILAIEGNTNNDGSREGYEVAEKRRPRSYCDGFGRWDRKAASAAVKPPHGGGESEDDVRPELTSVSDCRASVPAGKWRSLKWPKEHRDDGHHHAKDGYSGLSGPCLFDATATIELDAPQGAQGQARFILVDVRGGKAKLAAEYRPVEWEGTPGKTFVQLSQMGGISDEHLHLWVQVASFGGVDAHVLGGEFRVLSWPTG